MSTELKQEQDETISPNWCDDPTTATMPALGSLQPQAMDFPLVEGQTVVCKVEVQRGPDQEPSVSYWRDLSGSTLPESATSGCVVKYQSPDEFIGVPEDVVDSTSPGQALWLTQEDNSTQWTEEKNSRRCLLIDKEIEGTLSSFEQLELEILQAEMLKHRRSVAPLPLKDLRELHLDLWHATNDELWGIVRNEDTHVSQRSEALAELIANKEDNVCSYVVAELSRACADQDWNHFLIVAAERLVFSDSNDRETLKSILINAAVSLRELSDLKLVPVVWSAIRKYTSLINYADASSLADFLLPSDYVDTRQVALQSIQNLFSSEPPNTDIVLGSLQDRVFEIAQSLLNVHVLSSSENASLAINALHALAVLGDDRLEQCAVMAGDVGKRWFVERMTDVLEYALNGWELANPPVEQAHPAWKNLAKCIAILKENLVPNGDPQ